MAGFTAGHTFGLGDMAEPCKGCGLSFSNAFRHNLPCEGRYGHLDEQALYDAAAVMGGWEQWAGEFEMFRERMGRYYAGTYGKLRWEVGAIVRDVLWPRSSHAGPEYAGRVA